MDQKSNEYSVYIPRVALSSSSSSNSSRLREFAKKPGPLKSEVSATSGESESEGIYSSSIRRYDALKASRDRSMYLVHKAPKHSTKSSSLSSSSTDNRSNYSVNSLLLSVRNLENFNKSSNAPRHLYTQETLGSNYEQKKQMLENIRTILAIDDINLTNANDKTKDTDELSTASSMTTTNFTVVTFNDFNRRVTKSRAICRRSHRVTILIIVMSFLFFFVISGLVCMLEMRYQKMPR